MLDLIAGSFVETHFDANNDVDDHSVKINTLFLII